MSLLTALLMMQILYPVRADTALFVGIVDNCSAEDRACYKSCEANYGEAKPGKWWNCQGECDKNYRECGKQANRVRSCSITPQQLKTGAQDFYRKKRLALRSGVQDLERIQHQLKSDSAWERSASAELVAHLAKLTKTTTDLIEGLGGFLPTGKAASTAKLIYENIEDARKLAHFLADDSETLARDTLLRLGADVNPLIHGLGVAKDLGENILDLTRTQREASELRGAFAETLATNQKQIKAFEAQIVDAEKNIRDDSLSGLLEKYDQVREMCSAGPNSSPGESK